MLQKGSCLPNVCTTAKGSNGEEGERVNKTGDVSQQSKVHGHPGSPCSPCPPPLTTPLPPILESNTCIDYPPGSSASLSPQRSCGKRTSHSTRCQGDHTTPGQLLLFHSPSNHVPHMDLIERNFSCANNKRTARSFRKEMHEKQVEARDTPEGCMGRPTSRTCHIDRLGG
jgi:hypothetical protein